MVSRRIKNLKPSGIRQFFDLVLGMEDVISLGVGEPDFSTPWVIREKAIWTLEEGLTSYTSNKGLLSLRQAISKYLQESYNVYYDPEEEILITTGVSEGLDLSIRALIERGERVIVPKPYYVAYPAVVILQEGKPLYLELKEEERFKISPSSLEALLKKKPKAIILNYPSNPTGISYTREELREIWRILRRKEIFILSDEIYSELSFDFKHTAFSTMKGAKKRTILLGGFSKNYAMTGFRLGYVCGVREIISSLTKIHQYTILSSPTLSQFAALEALRSSSKDVERMRKEYIRRREFIISGLEDMGLALVKPQGAFYCFVNIKTDGFEFAKRLLHKKKVAVIPGEAFGEEYKNYIRIAYAQEIEILREALVRIKDFLLEDQI